MERLEQARELADQGDFEGALLAYREAQRDNPSSMEALLGQALMHVELEQYLRARECFVDALREDPEHDLALAWIQRLDRVLAGERTDGDAKAEGPGDSDTGADAPWSEERVFSARVRRKMRRIRSSLRTALVLGLVFLVVLIVLATVGLLRWAGSPDSRPPLPQTAEGLLDLTGAMHCLVPGVLLRIEQQGKEARVRCDLTLSGPSRDQRLESGYRSERLLRSGTLRLEVHEGGWLGDLSLGHALLPDACQRARTQAEVKGWEALDAGNVEAARRHFLQGRREALAAPGPLVGLIAADYAEGLHRKVIAAADDARKQKTVRESPLFSDYLAHLRESAVARQLSQAGRNAMDVIVTAAESLPQPQRPLPEALRLVLAEEGSLALDDHGPEIEGLAEAHRRAYLELRGLRNRPYCYFAEELVPGRLEHAWRRYEQFNRLNGLAEVQLLVARRHLALGQWDAARGEIEWLGLLGARLLQAGLEGQGVLRTAVGGYRLLLRDPNLRSAEQATALLGNLVTLRQGVSFEQVRKAQRGNLIALIGRVQAVRDDGYQLGQQLALAELDLALVAAALRAVERSRGAFPESLDELKADLAAAWLLDPFDGQPLRYVPKTDSALVYSVGPDGKDDGGAAPLGWTSANPLDGDLILSLSSPR